MLDWLDILQTSNSLTEKGEPLYCQIRNSLKDAIESGRLPAQTKLPTNRELASLLKIDRSTVSRAYAELIEAGLIDSHVGRGTYVKEQKSLLIEHSFNSSKSSLGGIDWTTNFSRASQMTNSLLSREPVFADGSSAAGPIISFAGGIPTEEFYPHEQFEGILSNLVKAGRAADMFSYSPAIGHPHLIAQVQKHLAVQGVHANDDEILIVSGSQQGISLVCDTLLDAGDTVILEEPSYFWAICNFQARQARCQTVPLVDGGMDLRLFERALQQKQVKLVYTMPNFQNPTGSSMSLGCRQQIIKLCTQYQVPILEDNFVGDLRYEGQSPPPMRALPGGRELVIHQGTFSKALCPGLRLGWLVGPAPLMERIRLAKRTLDLSTSSIAQIVLAEYLEKGLYKEHLERIRLIYKSRRDTMIGALQKYVGNQFFAGSPQLTWSVPEGGLFMWARLPDGFSSRELLIFAQEQGVRFSVGDLFFCEKGGSQFLRLCFIQQNEKTIEEGVVRLAQALSNYFDSVTIRRAKSFEGAVLRHAENILI
jgi:2-aminoadipate transaminase